MPEKKYNAEIIETAVRSKHVFGEFNDYISHHSTLIGFKQFLEHYPRAMEEIKKMSSKDHVEIYNKKFSKKALLKQLQLSSPDIMHMQDICYAVMKPNKGLSYFESDVYEEDGKTFNEEKFEPTRKAIIKAHESGLLKELNIQPKDAIGSVKSLIKTINNLSKKANKSWEKNKDDEFHKHISDLRKVNHELSLFLDPRQRRVEKMFLFDLDTHRTIARVGHEVNNHLNLLIGSINLMDDGLTTHKENRGYLDDVSKRINTLNNYAEYVFNPKPFEPVHINSFIEGLEPNLKPEGYDGVNLKLKLDKKVGNIDLVKHNIQMVFENLVKNACEAGAKNIKISTENDDSGHVYLNVWNDNSFIPEDKREAIFERGATFSFGKKKGVKGTGIGLDAVKDYVQQHCGQIEVTSDEKKGTKFSIRLYNAVRDKE